MVVATGSDRNSNEAVAGAASEAFAGWLHHRCVPVGEGDIASPLDTLFHHIIYGIINRTEFVDDNEVCDGWLQLLWSLRSSSAGLRFTLNVS